MKGIAAALVLSSAACLSMAGPASAAAVHAPLSGRTASGIEYRVLRPAKGAHPGPADTVRVNYRGMLASGLTFDATRYDEPITIRLDEVIPGWTEAVQLMTAGSKYRFVIPPALAYGAEGAGGVIPPDATLTFDIELLAINPPD